MQQQRRKAEWKREEGIVAGRESRRLGGFGGISHWLLML
jgi:hypothetical protein